MEGLERIRAFGNHVADALSLFEQCRFWYSPELLMRWHR
jgi:hypothetical protein